MYVDDRLIRLSGKAAFLLGITRILADRAYLLIPVEQHLTPQFLPTVTQDYSVLLVIRKVTNRVRSVKKSWRTGKISF